ncbi:uncharacterized protein LOC100175157 isoform X1 [Ciona intestinalis]
MQDQAQASEVYLFQLSYIVGGVLMIANTAAIMHTSVSKLIRGRATKNSRYTRAVFCNGPNKLKPDYCEPESREKSENILSQEYLSPQYANHVSYEHNENSEERQDAEQNVEPASIRLTYLLFICCTFETLCIISSTIVTGARYVSVNTSQCNNTSNFLDLSTYTQLADLKSIYIVPFLSTLAVYALSAFPVLFLSTKPYFEGWFGRIECSLIILTFVLISRCIGFVFFPHNFIQGCRYNLFIQRIVLPWFVYLSMLLGVRLTKGGTSSQICNESQHYLSNFSHDHIPERNISQNIIHRNSWSKETFNKTRRTPSTRVLSDAAHRLDAFMPCVVLMKKQASISHKQCVSIGMHPNPRKTKRRASLDVIKEHNVLTEGLRWRDVMNRRRTSLPAILASSKRKAVMSSTLVDTSTLVEIQSTLEKLGKSPALVESLVEDLQNLLKPYKTDHVRPRQVVWLHDSGTDGSDDDVVSTPRHSAGKRSASRRTEWNPSKDIFSTTTTATGLPTEEPAPAKPKRLPKISKEKSPLVSPLDSRCSSPVIDSSIRANLGRRKTYPSLPSSGSQVYFPSSHNLLSVHKKFPTVSSDYESCDNEDVTSPIARSKSVNEKDSDPLDLHHLQHHLHQDEEDNEFQTSTSQLDDDITIMEEVVTCCGNQWSDDELTDDGYNFFLHYQQKLLESVYKWNFPIFTLAQQTDCVLSQMAFKLFQDTGLFETFKIPKQEFVQYMRALEEGYRNIPYHNRIHAADVLHGCWYLSTQAIPGFHESSALFSSDSSDSDSGTGTSHNHCQVNNIGHGSLAQAIPALELMSLYLAAAMHDYDHPGRTNAFLVETRHPLAILYNDRSVLENHHASSSWGLLYSDPRFNFLKNLDTAEWKRLRFLVVEAILATDLKKHGEILSQFSVKSQNGLNWSADADRLLVCQMVIKLADIGGPAKQRNLHITWTKAICEEFFIQGDEERELGVPVSPFMDRERPQVAELQRTFINNLIKPIVQSMHKTGILAGKAEDNEADESSMEDQSQCLLLEQLKDNLNFWEVKAPTSGHEEMNEAFKLALHVDLSMRNSRTNQNIPNHNESIDDVIITNKTDNDINNTQQCKDCITTNNSTIRNSPSKLGTKPKLQPPKIIINHKVSSHTS